jgi:hypothetical protein
MTVHALIAGADLAAPLAWRNGRPISRAQYLADVLALAAQLPAHGSPLNLSGDRYRFAVGLGAAMVRGHISLLPPNHTPDTIERLQRQFPDLYALADPGRRRAGCRRSITWPRTPRSTGRPRRRRSMRSASSPRS